MDFRYGFINVGMAELSGVQMVISYDVNLGRFNDLTAGLNPFIPTSIPRYPG